MARSTQPKGWSLVASPLSSKPPDPWTQENSVVVHSYLSLVFIYYSKKRLSGNSISSYYLNIQFLNNPRSLIQTISFQRRLGGMGGEGKGGAVRRSLCRYAQRYALPPIILLILKMFQFRCSEIFLSFFTGLFSLFVQK